MRSLAVLVAVAVALWFLLFRNRGAALTVTPDEFGNPPEPERDFPAAVTNTGAVSDGGTGNDALDNFMQAIANMEGNGSTRNNPGNIKAVRRKDGSYVQYPGMVGVDESGFAIGGDEGDGWGWLQNLTERRTAANPDWNFYQWFNYYLRGSTTAPAVDKEGNSVTYAKYVADYMGVDPSMHVADAIGIGA